METSLFIQWVSKFMPGIVARVTETLNGTKTGPTYLFQAMLREDESVDGKWESISTANTLVAADVVAMDSALPLKKRDSKYQASGDIPKMGLRMQLNERQLTDLDTLVARGAKDSQIVAKLFADTPKVIAAILERIEFMFLQGLSSGVTLVEDADNVGTGVRLDYGYFTANKFGVAVLWSTAATATPLDDFKRVIAKAKADGNTITNVMMDSTAFDNLAATKQVKDSFAFSQGFVGTTVPTPDFDQVNALMQRKYKFTIQIVDRSVRIEKNGIQTAKKPWQDGSVVFVCSTEVGTVVYATLAEKNHKVAGVTYEDSGSFTLVSKYRKNEPSLSEWTASQARVVPVITNVDQIYLIDSKTVQA